MKEKLESISMEVTSVCNLDCKYCYNIWKIPGKDQDDPFNSYSKARKTLKRLFSIADINTITFTGGEPFLDERFPELVLFARMKKKKVNIITNGNAGYEKDYKQMIDLGVSLFELPIHSYDPDVHDLLTETKGSWQNSVNSIKFLRENGANVVVVIVITNINFAHLAATLEFIHSFGIRSIMLNRFNIGGKGITQKETLKLTKEQLNHAFSQASSTGRQLNLLLSSNVCTPMCYINPKEYGNIAFGICSTDVQKRPLTIDIRGNLRFCNHSPIVLGNIFKQPLKDILYNEKTEQWSKLIPEYCNTCHLYSKCMAGCRAAGEQLNLSLNYPDPILLT
jgi:radical SAM protein with 4Fe4S-binding SPASM domain